MAAEKAEALVLRTTDWSETSRIATLWTREHGKVRVLAKGGRRLKSPFENALDLLTHCSIVFLRKSSGSLDLLTEARVVQRFSRLRSDLAALYAAYYVAELLTEWTEDYDPHPRLFDEALATLLEIGSPAGRTADVGPRTMRFEAVLLHELGYAPSLDVCAVCGEAQPGTEPLSGASQSFSAATGGVLCAQCARTTRDRQPLSTAAWRALRELFAPGEGWRGLPDAVRPEVRRVLGHYVTYRLGRRPRMLPYLGS
jgi:DNA repair protein RecO (recombination protein O)